MTRSLVKRQCREWHATITRVGKASYPEFEWDVRGECMRTAIRVTIHKDQHYAQYAIMLADLMKAERTMRGRDNAARHVATSTYLVWTQHHG